MLDPKQVLVIGFKLASGNVIHVASNEPICLNPFRTRTVVAVAWCDPQPCNLEIGVMTDRRDEIQLDLRDFAAGGIGVCRFAFV